MISTLKPISGFLYLVVMFVGFSSANSANADYFGTKEYQTDKNCIATYSLARDNAFDSNQMDLYRNLSDYQNKIYLKHPSGHFPYKHIKAAKVLIKIRVSEKGIDHLDKLLVDCGYKS